MAIVHSTTLSHGFVFDSLSFSLSPSVCASRGGGDDRPNNKTHVATAAGGSGLLYAPAKGSGLNGSEGSDLSPGVAGVVVGNDGFNCKKLCNRVCCYYKTPNKGVVDSCIAYCFLAL